MPKLHCTTVKPLRTHTSTCIFLHGLGDSGSGWQSAVELIQRNGGNHTQGIKWVLPHAPMQPVTVNMGMKMPSWYDIFSFDRLGKMDREGMMRTRAAITEIIEEEHKAGIPYNKIIVGGFSQGCVSSLLAGLTSTNRLAGILGLSGYIPLSEELPTLIPKGNAKLPIFLAHGTSDPTIKFELAQASAEFLRTNGFEPEFKPYPGLGHSVSPQEIKDVQVWLEALLGKDANM